MTLLEALTLAYNLLVLITLVVLVWQGILQRRTSDIQILEDTYRHYFDIDKLAIQHPELQLYGTSGAIQAKIAHLDEEALRQRAYLELLLDVHELMFIKQQNGYYGFDEDYLRSLIENPGVAHYWQEWRGNYRSDFASIVDALIDDCQRPAKPEV